MFGQGTGLQNRNGLYVKCLPQLQGTMEQTKGTYLVVGEAVARDELHISFPSALVKVVALIKFSMNIRQRPALQPKRTANSLVKI